MPATVPELKMTRTIDAPALCANILETLRPLKLV